jgi:hypothetical protein
MRKEITLMEISDLDNSADVETASVWLEEKDGLFYVGMMSYEGEVFKKELSPKQLVGLKNFLEDK